MRNTARGASAIVAALSCAALLLNPFTTTPARADTNGVVTEPVGFYKVDLLTNSDTYTSIPFTRIPEFSGLVASVAGNVINVSNSPAWTPTSQWATPSTPNGYYPYYVKLESGNAEGAFYTITNNGASTLSVILSPEDLSQVAAGDRIRIIPFWTLGTVFPGGTGVVTSTSTSIHKTEILFPNIGGFGKNLSAAATYFYFNNAWRKVGAVTTTNDDVIILPDQYFIGRQVNGADTTTYLAPGLVTLSKLRIPLYSITTSNLAQDNFVAIYRPANQTLNESDLTNAFLTSTSTSIHKDELLVYDNTVQQRNKSAAATYFYYNGAWRKVGAVTLDFGPSNVFNTATGYIVRKNSNTTSTAIWVNKPNYSN